MIVDYIHNITNIMPNKCLFKMNTLHLLKKVWRYYTFIVWQIIDFLT